LSKKRKVVVRQGFYQKGSIVAKKFKIMTDGKVVKEGEFAEEIARTLGAYATANQYSVGTLMAQLKRKNLLISKLEAKVATAEVNVKSEVRRALRKPEKPTCVKSRSSGPTSSRCANRHKLAKHR
jgi:hypothetical protein